MKLRISILWVTLLIALGFVNYAIFQKEELIENGQPVFLRLAPVDPRSLIQGDYMALGYEIATKLPSADLPVRGKLVIKRSADGIASFVRIYDGQTALAADEMLLNYYQHDWQVSLGAESFFFQEGEAKRYETARYAELRVEPSGKSILIGLRGEKLEGL